MTLPRFKGKYRVESTRLSNRDYAANGWYFVTICSQNRAYFFGDVIAGQMQLSAVGKIAQQFWAEIPNHFTHTYIDAYVIMPNHIHGIVVIDRPPTSSIIASTTTNVETRNFASLHHHEQNIVSHHHERNSGYEQQLDTQTTDRTNKFAPLKPGSLQAIIHAYKSAVTRWCRKNGFDNFGWQPRFYDHIIRADGSLERIAQYIINNPAKWAEDREKPPNLWM